LEPDKYFTFIVDLLSDLAQKKYSYTTQNLIRKIIQFPDNKNPNFNFRRSKIQVGVDPNTLQGPRKAAAGRVRGEPSTRFPFERLTYYVENATMIYLAASWMISDNA